MDNIRGDYAFPNSARRAGGGECWGRGTHWDARRDRRAGGVEATVVRVPENGDILKT